MVPNALLRYARISEETKRQLLYKIADPAEGHPEFLTFDQAGFQRHLRQIADDRFAFARRQISMAEDLSTGLTRSSLTNQDDLPLRMISARCYYAVHHALRAMHLVAEQWDPDGHEATLTRTRKLLTKTPAAQASFGAMDVHKEAKTLLDRRHVADYHFYNQERVGTPLVDFSVAAPQALIVSQQILTNCLGVIQKKRAGVF